MRKEAIQALALLFTTLLLGSCGKSVDALAQESADMAERQAALTASRELDVALDNLEARLHSGRATVRLWSELAERHREVSEVACQNATMHSEAMAQSERRDRVRAETQRRNRVAQASRSASDVQESGYDVKATSAAPARTESASP
jgi:hypothetical protein